jgi:hypothetical protein
MTLGQRESQIDFPPRAGASISRYLGPRYKTAFSSCEARQHEGRQNMRNHEEMELVPVGTKEPPQRPLHNIPTWRLRSTPPSKKEGTTSHSIIHSFIPSLISQQNVTECLKKSNGENVNNAE